jgi:hypothetical protein
VKALVTSTPPELADHAALALDVLAEAGWETTVSDPIGAASVAEGVAAVDRADLVLALVGWRLGPRPESIDGWDGASPWICLEVRRAFALGKPVVVLMATEAWSEREESPGPRATMADFRAEVGLLAVAVDPPVGAELTGFQNTLESELGDYRKRSTQAISTTPFASSATQLTLRRWDPPPFPPEPWPLLLPYTHPDLLGGRGRELSELMDRLRRPQPILGLHGLSGTGKSSLLAGGLVPRLRGEGRPVAYTHHPAEPGLTGQLVGDLLAGPAASLTLADAEVSAFLDRILLAGHRAGTPPILVIDQIEELLRGPRSCRATLGLLLAATVQRRPGMSEPPCHWLLAYRREYHGELVRWLDDVLREARALGLPESHRLPHALGTHDRFHAWALPVLGAPSSSEMAPEDAALAAFSAAIDAPLSLRDESGQPRYSWTFADDGARRLAAAFAATRLAEPEAPLAPELQVVLGHLMNSAAPPQAPGGAAVLAVPEDPATLIDDALQRHLERALASAFPPGERIGRTRALLALYELAGDGGARGDGRRGSDLALAIGHQGQEILRRLQAPDVRLVVAREAGDDTLYTLSHDRLAEVVAEAVEGRGRLSLDPELLALRRFVVLRTELFHGGEQLASTVVASRQAAAIEAHSDCLLVDRERRDWWQACRRRRRSERRAAWTQRSIALLVITGLVWTLWSRHAAESRRQTLLEIITRGEPGAALASLDEALRDPKIEADELRAQLAQREAPLDPLEKGLAAIDEPRRSTLVLEVGELALPLLVNDAAAPDPIRIASLLWALDYAPLRQPQLADRAFALRDRALAELRRRHPPPSIDLADPEWVIVPAGSVRLGLLDREAPEDVRPTRDLAAFRMLAHEVTNAEYRRFDPNYPDDDLPATGMLWYEAYVYAAWLGGRLPSEAEWKYAAAAECAFDQCFESGDEAQLTDIAWTRANSTDPVGGEPRPHSVQELPANPLGLFDIYGNAWEFTADWNTNTPVIAYPDALGPPGGLERVIRGGSFRAPERKSVANLRLGIPPELRSELWGLRPILPEGYPPLR